MASATVVRVISGSRLRRSASDTAALVLRRVLLGGSPPHLQMHHQAVPAVLCCVGEVPATPASAILSIIIDLLQRRSFSKSIYESSAGRSAHTQSQRCAHRSSPVRRATHSPATQLPRASALGHRAHQRHEMKLCTCGSSRQETTRTDSGLGRGDFSQCAVREASGMSV